MENTDNDTGILGWYESNKKPLIIMVILYLISVSFFIGFRKGAAEAQRALPLILAQHRMIVLNEAVNSVNAPQKNRAKFEVLKFRASHLGVGLVMDK